MVCIFYGKFYIWALLTLLSTLCLNEILSLKAIPKWSFLYIVSLILLIGITITTWINPFSNLWHTPVVTIIVCTILGISGYELYNKKSLSFTSPYLISGYSLCLIGFTLPFAIIIRNQVNGLYDAIFILAVVACTDSAAYFTGKILGHTALTSLSPKKTIEGSIGGTLTGIITGLIIIHLLSLPLIPYTLLACIIVIISQLGDIHESLIKRTYHVKDSSSFLPGHGGVYDRLDGYIFTFPIFYYSKLLIMGYL